ncbi:MAG: M20/M25/M40 family metallo-hydrolase [bacterium]
MRRARRLAGAGVALALVAASACSSGSGDGPAAERETALRRALASISAEGLAAHVDVLASDDDEGRQPGSGGHRRARDYLIDALARAQVERGGIDGTSYLHLYSTEPNPRYLYPYPTGHNLVGLLRGSDPVHGAESVIVMAHYDHVGRDRFRHVFNGAYDNAAGVAALIELARAFQDVGYAPKRTIVWLFTDEEETGLRARARSPTPPPCLRRGSCWRSRSIRSGGRSFPATPSRGSSGWSQPGLARAGGAQRRTLEPRRRADHPPRPDSLALRERPGPVSRAGNPGGVARESRLHLLSPDRRRAGYGSVRRLAGFGAAAGAARRPGRQR